MEYDVIVIGAGISGLTAAGLLAKRGLKVIVAEHADKPGGSCGIFKRENAVFDQGAAMLYGFGEHGFNAHRFVFNCLQEPFTVVKHDLLYVVHYQGKQIRFLPDIDAFIEELSAAFPGERAAIRRFYKTMQRLYSHVISRSPSYTTPDETNPREALRSVLRHPFSYLKFLSYLNISAEKLLRRYFTDPDLLHFFDKLTSTYCYATIAEAPAIMASVMFIDNHEGGSYYPAGSTLFLPGVLEKVIEENGGIMRYESTVTAILFDEGKPCGVRLQNGVSSNSAHIAAAAKSANTESPASEIYARSIIYSGTVWNLYEKLLPEREVTDTERQWERAQQPTYPSVVFYALVNSSVISPGTCPIEMLTGNPAAIDESEITVYILSLDDNTLCPEGQHTVVAVGPSFQSWEADICAEQKQTEIERFTDILQRRFPGFKDNILHCELATPRTIARYTLKNGGAVAGPKQMLGQHMLLRQPIRTRWETLFCCGESTAMGTGTPTVTTSGIAAANAVLKLHGLKPYVWDPQRENQVRILKPPLKKGWHYNYYEPETADIMSLAGKCRFCNQPSCCEKGILDIPGIMRRTACGNFIGAGQAIQRSAQPLTESFIKSCEKRCVQTNSQNKSVPIAKIIEYLNTQKQRSPSSATEGF